MGDETDETVVLMQAMAKIRAKRRRRLSELSHETDRLTDWREYVKSAPYAAVAVAAVAGFVVAGRVIPGSSKAESESPRVTRQPSAKPAKSGVLQSVAAAAVSLAVPMVSMAVRRYAVDQFLNFTRNSQHEPAQSTEPESVVR